MDGLEVYRHRLGNRIFGDGGRQIRKFLIIIKIYHDCFVREANIITYMPSIDITKSTISSWRNLILYIVKFNLVFSNLIILSC